MRQLTVYVRRGCHLCTDMTQALERLRQELDIEINTVDIDRDQELLQRYSTRVPVLVVDDVEICYYFLEETPLRQHLSSHANSSLD
jgi:glutaredoxin